MATSEINPMRIAVLISSIQLYLSSGLKSTRTATPTNMSRWASEYTGRAYKRSSAGLQMALVDLKALYDNIIEASSEKYAD